MKHTLFLFFLSATIAAASPVPADEHFRVEEVAGNFADAMEIAVSPDGEIFVVERTGAVKIVNPKNGNTRTLDTVEVEVKKGEYARECGLLGIALDPAYANNKWVYLYYSVPVRPMHRLSRFTVTDTGLKQEKVLLEVAHDRENATCHEAGSLAFGPDGLLYLSTGDNTCPFRSNGSAPIDEREGRLCYDAQRSAGNTNDLRGKILRIRPTAEGGYIIPQGNLFPIGTPKTRPEIYVMGCRNPYRISIDSRNSFLYWGKVGPDAGNPSERGPRGYDEINQARQAGNFGWPYFSGDNRPYADYDFENKVVSEKFNVQTPLNTSIHNTGLEKLPPAQPAFWFYPSATACAGPVYYTGDFPDSPTKLPASLDSCLIVYDWTSNWIRLLKLDQNGDLLWNEPWLSKHRFVHPNDMAMSPQGELYLLEYGSKWYDGDDGKLKRITYSAEPIPIEVPATDPRMVGLPEKHPGSSMISKSTCLACHLSKNRSIGPSYEAVAKKYAQADEATRESLAEKILKGGSGTWGQQPMPPHPQHNIEEALQMIDAILKVK